MAVLGFCTSIGTFAAWPARSCSCPQKAGEHKYLPSTSRRPSPVYLVQLTASRPIASTRLGPSQVQPRPSAVPLHGGTPLLAETRHQLAHNSFPSSLQPQARIDDAATNHKPDAVALRLPHRGKHTNTAPSTSQSPTRGPFLLSSSESRRNEKLHGSIA